MHINKTRLLGWMEEQATIGATPDGGLSRPALSEADLAVRAWFEAKIYAAGLVYHMDGAGNQSGVLKSDNPQAKTLLIGSHLDSVPNGGRYDGALGVLVGLEVLQTVKESGLMLPFHLEVVNFTDEEGTLRGLLGSCAFTGRLEEHELDYVRGGGDALEDGLLRAGLNRKTFMTACRDAKSLLGYLEVHIEQGRRLEQAGLDIGVVTSIVGVRSFWLHFIGEAAHAGTRPMPERRDAIWGAMNFIQHARQMVLDQFQPGVMNCGEIAIEHSAFNIVPSDVRISLEFRHGDTAQLDAMQAALFRIANESAAAYGLGLDIQPAGIIEPAVMAEQMVKAVETGAARAGVSHTRLMSFAGHDAQSLAYVTPSAMFFVPCLNGISHNPMEYATPEVCANAAEVMLQTVLHLCDEQ
ncbi:MAG: Zn-dependent hydrolase [Chloroflexi bacterium AL-W]|nr:Zn-dependent hydrolase [Chloroflexi bacterium AL-W]